MTMKTLIKILCVCTLTISTVNAKLCEQNYGLDGKLIPKKYGDNIQYLDLVCMYEITSTKINDEKNRKVLFTEDGQVQFISNFPGSTLSNSSGSRIYYFFPTRNEQKILTADNNHLLVKHSSGFQINFDKNGNMTSPDLTMKISNDINSENKGGVEIATYSKGLVIDVGYSQGRSPLLDKQGIVTITDKHNKQCLVKNNEFHTIIKFKSVLTHPTNESMYHYLKEKCPELDLFDLMAPLSSEIKNLITPASFGGVPPPEQKAANNNNKREAKPLDISSDVKNEQSTNAIEK